MVQIHAKALHSTPHLICPLRGTIAKKRDIMTEQTTPFPKISVHEFAADRVGEKYEQNITDAAFAIADAIYDLAAAVRRLGNADSSSPMGAIENLSLEIKNGFDELGSSLADPLDAIARIFADSLENDT
jgi:hypothetical protein